LLRHAMRVKMREVVSFRLQKWAENRFPQGVEA
jgi:hypothetical protein